MKPVDLEQPVSEKLADAEGLTYRPCCAGAGVEGRLHLTADARFQSRWRYSAPPARGGD
jgi:hypothetical protein